MPAYLSFGFTMFGTLRYDRESQHAEFIDRTQSFLGDAATEHAACDKCRLTKVRFWSRKRYSHLMLLTPFSPFIAKMYWTTIRM